MSHNLQVIGERGVRVLSFSHLISSAPITPSRVVGAAQWRTLHQLAPYAAAVGKCLGCGEALPCPFSDVVCPFLLRPASSSLPLHWSLQYGLGEPIWSCHMSIPSELPFLDCGQQVFALFYLLGDGLSDFFAGNAVHVWNAKESSEASHLQSLDPSL